MQLQLFFTPRCVECVAVKILLKRIAPDYPDLQVDATDLASRPNEARVSGTVSAPQIVIDGQFVARKHVKEAELRRLTRKVATGEPAQMLLPLGLPPPPSTGNGSTPH